MTDFLDEKRREISDRLKELKPYVDEYNRLESAASALASVRGASSSGGATATAPATAKRRRGPGRPKGSRTTATVTAKKTAARKPGRPPGRPAKRRAGRRKGSGTRAAEALSFVTAQPGITIPELAAKMGIKQNYL